MKFTGTKETNAKGFHNLYINTPLVETPMPTNRPVAGRPAPTATGRGAQRDDEDIPF
jgi:hypothetical protein